LALSAKKGGNEMGGFGRLIKIQELKGGVKVRATGILLVILLWAGIAYGKADLVTAEFEFVYPQNLVVSEGTYFTIFYGPKDHSKSLDDYIVKAELPLVRNGSAAKDADVKISEPRSGVIVVTPLISGQYSGTLKVIQSWKDTSIQHAYVYPPVVSMANGRLSKVRIPKVPKGATIRIFDESNHLVWEYSVTTDTGTVEYDVTNNSGLTLSEGLYIVSIEMKGQKPRLLTVVVKKQ